MNTGLKTVEAIETQEAFVREDVLDNPGTIRRLIEPALEQGSKLEAATAGEILEWGVEHLHTPLAATLSIRDMVLVGLAARHAPEADLIFLDTGHRFPETLDVAERAVQRYSNRLLSIKSKRTRAKQDAEEGVNLYRTDPARCCALWKAEPLLAVKRLYGGWVTGPKCADAPARTHVPVSKIDKTGRIKLNPLVTQTDEDIAQYTEDDDLIVHPLTQQEFPSVGCTTCTARVAEGADPYSGRWAGSEETERRLHLQFGRLVAG